MVGDDKTIETPKYQIWC